MKKLLTLSVLMLGVMLISVGAVSAVTFQDPELTAPQTGDYVMGEITVAWDNPENDPNIYIQYQEGECNYLLATTTGWTDLGPFSSTQTSTTIDTTELNDGDLCIRLRANGETYLPFASVIIDNEVPEVLNFWETTPMNPGANEYDEKVKVDYEHSDNNEVVDCLIEWGDGKTFSCDTSTGIHSKQHQYQDNGNYVATITVWDQAGNSASESIDVEVANVVPWNVEVHSLVNVAAMGEIVRFKATGEDVEADLPLEYTWYVDGNEIEGSISEFGDPYLDYVWQSASDHDVMVCAFDGDDETCSTSLIMTIEEPEHMEPMQRAVVNKAFKFDLDSPWEANALKRFTTSISDITTGGCDLIVGPVGMIVTAVDGNKCKIEWEPTSDDKGIWSLESEDHNPIIIKAYNNLGEYKYYSFDVTVYNWGIELQPGWNLISIPLVPTSSNIKDVFESIHDNIYRDGSTWSVLQYDAVEDEWYKARTTTSGWSSASGATLDDIVPGYGYWIKMENADTLFGMKENFAPSNNIAPSIDLATGSWNLIGRYGLNPFNLNVDTAFESLEENFFEDGVYKYVGPSSFEATDILTVGEGYWMRTTIVPEFATISYEPISYYFN